MPDFDASNPYVREAVAAGISDIWIADFMRRNAGDYHRIMLAAAGDKGAYGGSTTPGTSGSSLTLTSLSPSYQAQVRPDTALAPSSLGASLAGGSPLVLLAVAAAAYYIYKKL